MLPTQNDDRPNVFVLGFCFSPVDKSVVLIEKKRPDWQAGKINGVGGHVKKYESPVVAMRREFCEEAGLDLVGWRQRFMLRARNGIVFVFQTNSEHAADCFTQTDERVGIYCVDRIHQLPTLPGLQWMIPMLLDKHLEEDLGTIRERIDKEVH